MVIRLGVEIALLLHVVIALLASGHAVLSNRETRGATGWVGVIWLAPLLGVLLYVWLGINRIEYRARSLRGDRPRPAPSSEFCQCPTEIVEQALTSEGTHLQHLITLVREVTRQPLLRGNRIASLVNGDQAYSSMLQAIEDASQSVSLTTYIFRNDHMGQ
jgi:cardiolipin synthase A/B